MKNLIVLGVIVFAGVCAILGATIIYVAVSDRTPEQATTTPGPMLGPRIEVRDIKIQLPIGAKILSHNRDTSDGEDLADDVWLAEVSGTEAETDSHFRKTLRADGWELYDLLTEPRSKLTAWSKSGLNTKTVIGIQHTGQGSLEIRVSPVF